MAMFSVIKHFNVGKDGRSGLQTRLISLPVNTFLFFQLAFEAAIFLFKRRLVSATWERFAAMLSQLLAPILNGAVGDPQLSGQLCDGLALVSANRTASTLNSFVSVAMVLFPL